MLLSLTAEEILEIAVEAERQGAAFYERLADSAQDERLKEDIVDPKNWTTEMGYYR